jgi:hypothetical protein
MKKNTGLWHFRFLVLNAFVWIFLLTQIFLVNTMVSLLCLFGFIRPSLPEDAPQGPGTTQYDERICFAKQYPKFELMKTIIPST